MNRIDTILFPTDLTDDAHMAFEYALEMARRTGARLHILHAIEEPYDFATRLEETMEALEEKAWETMDRLKAHIRERENYSDLQVEFHVERGSPKPVITAQLDNIKPDLMVMGTKSESNLKRLLFGDVTSDVILEADVPILTVPVNSKKPYLDRFLFATDFRSGDLESLRNTVHLARLCEAEIHILHVSPQKDLETEIKFRGFADYVTEKVDFDSFTFVHVEAPRFTDGVAEYTDKNPVSMLVITRYKKKFLSSLFRTSDTQGLPQQIHMPMLVLLSSGNQPDIS
ncbi:MAG: universal stress protein [Balneolaceae bacterium]|nr:universal stress protein [Balneolaceae bacterium]